MMVAPTTDSSNKHSANDFKGNGADTHIERKFDKPPLERKHAPPSNVVEPINGHSVITSSIETHSNTVTYSTENISGSVDVITAKTNLVTNDGSNSRESSRHSPSTSEFSIRTHKTPVRSFTTPSEKKRPSSTSAISEQNDIKRNSSKAKRNDTFVTILPEGDDEGQSEITTRKKVHRRNTYSADLADHIRGSISPSENETQKWSEQAKKQRRTSRRRKDKDEDTDRVVIGTRIDEDHVNYVLMYNMLTGIRVGVSRCNAKPQRPLTDVDFTAAHKLAFDITGNELTPSAKYDFKFKDYAPWVFRNLRSIFHIDAADYLVSLTSKYILSELGSPGKSGSFFYFSRDYRFIIKTIHNTEHKFMRKILKDYYEHVKENPHTLLSRFYGLHRVKLPRGRKIHFVVMNNIFPPHRDIHEIYDLKGSTIGREYPEEEAKKNPRAVLKDLNWLKRDRHLELGPVKQELFVKQLKKDVELLERLNIMDYSLLVGLHDTTRGNKDNIREDILTVFQPDTKKLNRVPSNHKRENKVTVSELRKAVKTTDPLKLGPSSTKLSLDAFSERSHCIFYSDDGGFAATDEDNSPKNYIYYLGIIDILTPYNFVKKIEHAWKSLSYDKNGISAVEPGEYGNRFLGFIQSLLQTQNSNSDSSPPQS
ncbi:7865_t:CDS:10 [Paraglomus occultum]|uniref:1-phosphatidylinositol-4-phosphate 5-kinase n=1 Tax=Paraglomus occultum TaxID=144539 RepID=A0A9N8ZFW9_9GLOM|nr:7865_t:CDS:10 [Paraglomus occultum]